MRSVDVFLLAWIMLPATMSKGGSFTTEDEPASKFGVHEVVLNGDGAAKNPFDTPVTVSFVPASDADRARRVQAFYDGDNTWRARVYVSESGQWLWQSQCETDPRLDGQTGRFTAVESRLRGRLLPHPKNPRQWVTEDGRFFLNLSDTAYFLLCRHDGNGDAVADNDAVHYLRDDVQHGITSLRCNLTCRDRGSAQSPGEWETRFFKDRTHDQFRLDNFQCADRRLQMLLNEQPDVAVQLTLFPLGVTRISLCCRAPV
jgi:hypothetical protein